MVGWFCSFSESEKSKSYSYAVPNSVSLTVKHWSVEEYSLDLVWITLIIFRSIWLPSAEGRGTATESVESYCRCVVVRLWSGWLWMVFSTQFNLFDLMFFLCESQLFYSPVFRSLQMLLICVCIPLFKLKNVSVCVYCHTECMSAFMSLWLYAWLCCMSLFIYYIIIFAKLQIQMHICMCADLCVLVYV